MSNTKQEELYAKSNSILLRDLFQEDISPESIEDIVKLINAEVTSVLEEIESKARYFEISEIVGTSRKKLLTIEAIQSIKEKYS